MKASELRIGNLVYPACSYPEPIEVDLENISDFENLKPIPLTEELYRKIQKQLFEVGLEYSYSSITNRLFIYIGNRTIICDFIHNIQNLYFALTNDELKYEL